MPGQTLCEDGRPGKSDGRGGAQLRPYPQDIMEAAFAASNALYAELSAANEDFRTIFASQEAFRNEANLWNQVAEYTFDTFMIRNRPKG